MKHVKQLLSALLVLAVVLAAPAGVLKASAAEAPAALTLAIPHSRTQSFSTRSMTCQSSASHSEKDIMMAIHKQ